jgi:hypothetical protein
MGVELDELVIGDEPAAWAGAGFTVDDDGTTCIGQVRVRLAGREAGKRILSWQLRGVPAELNSVDGLRTTTTDRPACTPGDHPNGSLAIDHLVALTPDTQRTIGTLGDLGVEVRRTREVDAEQYGFPAVQTFFRLGEPILELLGPAEPSGDGPAGFFGLALTVADLDALPARYGEAIGHIKDAVQPGRRIATLRHKQLDLSVAIAFMSPEP